MEGNRFTKVCFILVICLLAVIAFRVNTTHVYAATTFRYEVVSVYEGSGDQTLAAQLRKETEAGWELVAAPIWQTDVQNAARGFLVFRRPTNETTPLCSPTVLK